MPANIDLAGAEAMLLMRAGREYALKRALAKICDDFDVVIIDCPPSLGVLTLNGLTAADEVIVPLQCETLAHRGVGQFLRTITDVQQITNADLKLLGALPTLYDSRTTHSRDVLLDVADRYDLPVLAPPIPRTVRFAEASASGASVLASRKNKGATPTGSWPRAAQALEDRARRWRRSPRRSSRVSAERHQFVAALLEHRRARHGRHHRRLGGRALQRDVAFTGAGDRVEDVDSRRSRARSAARPSSRRDPTGTCAPAAATVYL